MKEFMSGALSPKEMEVLSYVVKGKRNKEIASGMCVTNDTVKAHIGSIMRKFKVTNRTEIAYFAWTNNILDNKRDNE